MLSQKWESPVHVGQIRHVGFHRCGPRFPCFSRVLPISLANCDTDPGVAGRGITDGYAVLSVRDFARESRICVSKFAYPSKQISTGASRREPLKLTLFFRSH